MPFTQSRQAKLLRIFIGDADRWEGRPLAEALVDAALAQGLAGATVLHGVMGYGAHARVHTANMLRLSGNLPVVVEIVDLPERIAAFLPTVETMVREGLVTLEAAEVLLHRPRTEPEA